MASPLRVLVVEDDRHMLTYLCALIAGWGYDCQAAVSAKKAIDSIVECCPDVVISDLVMPGLDGMDLLRRLRGVPGCSSFFVLITGYSPTAAAAVRAITEGADEVMVKPLQEEALHALLRRVAERRSTA